MTPREPAADYTGKWNHGRFLAECKRKGIGNATELNKLMGARLLAQGVPADMRPSIRTWQRVWKGETDPTLSGGSKGSRALLLLIADFFEVNPAWLLSSSRAGLISKSKGGAP